jgi:histidinol-phosphate aminotransferase
MKPIAHVPENIRTLIPYAPGKPIEEVEREYGITNSVKLASNENPLGPAPRALEAIRAKLGQLHLYPDGDCFYLKERVAEQLGVAPDQLIFGNGSNEIIELAARTFLRPGDEAVMARQAFIVYKLLVQAIGGVAKQIPLRDFTHDLEAIANAVSPKTRIVFLANPNNPTGTIYRREAWERFLERLPEEVLIIADEAYFEYVRDPEYPDSLHYHDRGKTILTLRTFSKLYGLAALRIGYGVAGKEVVDLMHRVRQPFNVNAVAQWAALAALDDKEHVRRSLAANREGMEFLNSEFDKLGLPYVPSHGNFVLVRVGNGNELYRSLLAQGVIVRPVGAYELPEHVRVTVGKMDENRCFIAALRRIIKTA